ncbi:HTH domain-containing protein [Halovenus sp. HT40]|uniref:HTH domain-containing protein n=1 Tax=Halovenus sp. HT40 TaxID=3126691 RepID=UPI003FA5E015
MRQTTRDNGESTSAIAEWWNEYGRNHRGNNHRVRVFVRSFAPAPGQHDRHRQLVEGLLFASSNDLITDYDVTVLGNALCTCEHCRTLPEAEALFETVATLREWRYEEMNPIGFTRRQVSSSLTGDRHEILIPPEISLGVYVDGSLAGVFPCATETETYRPERYVEDLLNVQHRAITDEGVTHTG